MLISNPLVVKISFPTYIVYYLSMLLSVYLTTGVRVALGTRSLIKSYIITKLGSSEEDEVSGFFV